MRGCGQREHPRPPGDRSVLKTWRARPTLVKKLQIAWVNCLRLVWVVANYITVADVGRPGVAVGERDVALAGKGIAVGRGQRSPRTPETGRGKGSEIPSRGALRLDDH